MMNQRLRLPAALGSAKATVPQLILAPLSLISAQPTFSIDFAAALCRFPTARRPPGGEKSDG